MRRIAADIAVIGAGTAGLAAYRAASAGGKRTVLIERGPHGTTCARVGCMPSKLLIAAADAAHGATRWAEFGLRMQGDVHIDGEAVMQRVRRERDRFVRIVLNGVEAIPQADRIEGEGRFVAPDRIVVGDHTEVSFSRVVIATGSSPFVPPLLRSLGDRLVVTDDLFEWRTLPRSVAILGRGVIGLELGQALARLGVRVWMFGASDSLGPFTDPAVRDYAARTFASDFHLDLNARVIEARRTDTAVEIDFVSGSGNQQRVAVDYVIAATGRTPNVEALDVKRLGIELDGNGIPVFDRTTLQCGSSPVFIAGDANADVPLLHEAADEGRIAGENAARYPDVEAGTRRAPLAIVFTDPQIAIVGARRAELKEGDYVVGKASFEDQGRSRVMLRNRGLLHLYAGRTSGRFVGAEMIAPNAEHLAHLLAWALQMKLPISQMLEMPFYHPVVEEGLRTALRDAQAQLEVSRRAVLRAA